MAVALNPPRNGEGDRRRSRGWRGTLEESRRRERGENRPCLSTSLRLVPLPLQGRIG